MLQSCCTLLAVSNGWNKKCFNWSNSQRKYNKQQAQSHAYTHKHKTSVYGRLALIGCEVWEEEESQGLAGRMVKGANSGRTFPPLLSSWVLREGSANWMTELLNGRPTPSTESFKSVPPQGALRILHPGVLFYLWARPDLWCHWDFRRVFKPLQRFHVSEAEHEAKKTGRCLKTEWKVILASCTMKSLKLCPCKQWKLF